LWHAGINPVALATFFEKLEKEGGGGGPQFLSDHPNPGNRKTAIQNEIKDWPAKQYSGDSPQFASTRQHAMGVKAYTAQEIEAGAKNGQWTAENKKNGAVFTKAPAPAAGTAGGAPGGASPGPASMPAVPLTQVQPSRTFQTADLGGLKIARPQNWDIIENQQDSATIAPKAGVANGAVAYGVVMHASQAPSANMNPTQLTQAVVQSLQMSDPNMKPLGQVQQTNVGGNAAGSVELQTISPMAGQDGKPQPEHDWLVAIPKGQTAIFFVFVSPQANYNQLRPTFQKMLSSVQLQ
jgi:hypothetical protein